MALEVLGAAAKETTGVHLACVLEEEAVRMRGQKVLLVLDYEGREVA